MNLTIRNIKHFIKHIIKNKFNYEEILKIQNQINEIPRLNTQIQQRQLQFHYKSLLAQNLPLPKFCDTGFRIFSQTDEDGILLYIFSLIGTTNKICLDIAFRSSHGANTTNLILNNGWNGILICGSKNEANEVKRFFQSHKDTFISPPKVYHKWITAENLNEVIEKGLYDLGIEEKNIDLFSLDIDGVDYWIWKALESVEPRVVIVEYHPFLRNKAVTIPYNPDFKRDDNNDYYGASLPAFVKLGKKKGYRLIGANRIGFNAFFIKRDIKEDILPEINYNECYKYYFKRKIDLIWKKLEKKYNWQEI